MNENTDYAREQIMTHFPINFMIWVAINVIPIITGWVIIDKVHYNMFCYPNKLEMFFFHPYLSLRNKFRKCEY